MEKYNGKKICVAVSGGADSTALLHYLRERKEAVGYRLFAVHCEHGIRGEESLADEQFVKTLCKEWNIPLFTFRADCKTLALEKKQSLETAAREFRRECFQSLIVKGEVDFIATAHHQDDEAETVLFRLARGASLSGARGIERENGYFIRPFLDWTKADILSYIKEHGLQFCVDATNFERDAARNKLRLDVLPLLENTVAGAKGNLARFARLAGEDDALLYELSVSLLKRTENGYTIAFSDKKPLFRRACLTALKGLGVGKDYTSLHLELAFSLQSLERGARIDLPKGVVAQKTVDGIAFFVDKQEENELKASCIPFQIGENDGGRYAITVSKTPIAENGEAWKALRLDGDKLPQDVFFRFREEGDTIKVFGGGTKTLKKLLNEKKIPVEERAFLPLLTDGDGRVYAVCGVEISESVKVTESTVNPLYIGIQKK